MNKVYKWCAVPQCMSTTIKTPGKLFVYVPHKMPIRNKWLDLARRDPAVVSANSPIYFCEDHFDLENDMANYLKYKMGFSKIVMMGDGVLPTKFDCQQGSEEGVYLPKKIYPNGTNSPRARKVKKKQPHEQKEVTLDIKNMRSNEPNEKTIRNKEIITKLAQHPVLIIDGTLDLNEAIINNCRLENKLLDDHWRNNVPHIIIKHEMYGNESDVRYSDNNEVSNTVQQFNVEV